MKIIKYQHDEYLFYPTGLHFSEAIGHAKRMAQAFATIEEFNDRQLKVFCRGSSGAILGSLFLGCLNWDNDVFLCYIKKDGERSHYSNSQYRILENDVVIIIDDMIESGETVRNILQYTGNRVDCLLLAENEAYTEARLYSKIDRLPQYLINSEINVL